MSPSRPALSFMLGGLLALGGTWLLLRHLSAPSPLPDPPLLLERVREVARLETLEVTIWKKVELDPDPSPQGSVLGDLTEWVHFSVDPPRGKAIVFAKGFLGLDASRLAAGALKVEDGGVMLVTLPPLATRVELEPGETEVIRSNLNSEETDRLLARAKEEIEVDLSRDSTLQARALSSAERSLRLLFLIAGFREVRFVGPLTDG